MKQEYTFNSIAQLLDAGIASQAKDTHIKRLENDSRSLSEAEATLFFAIKGKHHDGHQHLYECYLKGVRGFVIDDVEAIRQVPGEILPELNIMLVKNTVAALQELATRHREKFSLPVIGITGSNGKTVVKEWLFQLLHHDYHIVRSPKSYNSQIGVPLSVWQIQPEHKLGIFEAGISQPGEMEKLQKIIKPSTGIFTNIGEAHQASFTSLEQKAEEKLKLFEESDTLIYCTDYE